MPGMRPSNLSTQTPSNVLNMICVVLSGEPNINTGRNLRKILLAPSRGNFGRASAKISGYEPNSKSAPTDDAKLPDGLNKFYARFDRPVPNHPASSEPDEPPFQLTMHGRYETRPLQLNVKEAPGPDNISPGMLRCCEDELSDVLYNIFNWSLCSIVMCRMFLKQIPW